MLMVRLLIAIALCAAAVFGEEWQPIPRKIPPKGLEIPAEDRSRLEKRTRELYQRLEKLSEEERQPFDDAEIWSPDVLVFLDAVNKALVFGEFYKKSDVAKADWALEQAAARLDAFRLHPWTMDKGFVVRGYRSRIDRSVQGYGLEIPEGVDPQNTFVFLHGRGDKTTDLHFIHERAHKPGKIALKDAIIIHPFGRHCMGFKSAGEIDVLDVVDHAAEQYGTSRRPVLMGFSMGGAGVWHIGAHYPDRWSAIAPGAGFAETRRYIKLKAEDYPPVYEQTLWSIYDVPNYVRNLFNRPVFAYSGEIDKQKQAADVMAEAYAAEGRELAHLIGPETGHKYHPETLADLLSKLEAAHSRDQVPDKVCLQTRTLRYGRVFWVQATGLKQHWKDSRIDATFKDGVIFADTRNISSLSFTRPYTKVIIDGQTLERGNDGFVLTCDRNTWSYQRKRPGILRKRPGLQGPIDDAFLSEFVVCLPNSEGYHVATDKWVDFERSHFEHRWSTLYRGAIPVDQNHDKVVPTGRNVVLWGDPLSNPTLGRICKVLPIQWSQESITIGDQQFDARYHVVQMIYPNPESPQHYIVINSGPTHREGHDRTNSLQNPKLPDWAVVDVREAPSATAPGKVVAAGFFDENWQLKP